MKKIILNKKITLMLSFVLCLILSIVKLFLLQKRNEINLETNGGLMAILFGMLFALALSIVIVLVVFTVVIYISNSILKKPLDIKVCMELTNQVLGFYFLIMIVSLLAYIFEMQDSFYYIFSIILEIPFFIITALRYNEFVLMDMNKPSNKTLLLIAFVIIEVLFFIPEGTLTWIIH